MKTKGQGTTTYTISQYMYSPKSRIANRAKPIKNDVLIKQDSETTPPNASIVNLLPELLLEGPREGTV
jgi:hypothetical protein